MHIKVLGPGCNNCALLMKIVQEAVAELDLTATFEKVEDYADIMAYGIMSTPGLVVNETVVFSGKVPTKAHIKEVLKNT